MAVYESHDHDEWLRGEELKELMSELDSLIDQMRETDLQIDELRFVINMIKERKDLQTMFRILNSGKFC